MSRETFEQKLLVGSLAALPRGSRLLVGVSGGRDSVALLHALKAAGFDRMIVCHLNHGLRGRASEADARFVAALAAKLGLEAEIGRADVRARAKEGKCSIETAARDARYRFFAGVAARRRCGRVVLAHHADDQVETLLFNLFRGSGRAGLGGMKPESERAVPRERGKKPVTLTLLRPMLALWREEIDRYVQSRKLRYREDASNRSLDPMRNRLRLELIPLAERLFGREIRGALWRAGEILGAEEAWLAGLTPPEEGETLAVPELRAQPVAQQRRRVLAWLRSRAVADIGFEEVERVRTLLLEGGPAKVNLPGGRHARRKEKKLFIE